MKPRIVLLSLAGISVVAFLALRANRERASSHAAHRALATRHEQALREIKLLEERLRATRAAIVDLRAAETTPLAAEPTAVATKVGPPAHVPGITAREITPRSLVANDPKKMAVYLRNYRDGLDLAWGGFYKKWGLTPEQVEKAKDFRVWVEQNEMELQAVAETEGLGLQSDGYRKLRDEFMQARNRMTFETFGRGELMQRHRERFLLSYLYETVQRIASTEMGTDTPSTFAQVERAVEIIANNSEQKEPSNPQKLAWQTNAGWSWPDWAKINWSVAEPQLQRELLPGQYTFLRQLLRTQEAWTAVAARNAANQAEARKRVR